MAAPPLEPFGDGIFTTHRPQRFLGIECGTRMTVVRLSGGGLFVHSPVALDPDTRAAVDSLGPVVAVAAPSLYHHLYVGEWREAYPDAEFWACPGLDRKRPDVAWTGILGDTPPSSILPDVDLAPLTARFEREVVFFHRATRTMVCADALIHLGRHPSRITRLVAALMGNDGPGKGYLERVAVRDRRLARRQVDRIAEWDIEGIVLAHGELVPSGGREALVAAYAWVKPF